MSKPEGSVINRSLVQCTNIGSAKYNAIVIITTSQRLESCYIACRSPQLEGFGLKTVICILNFNCAFLIAISQRACLVHTVSVPTRGEGNAALQHELRIWTTLSCEWGKYWEDVNATCDQKHSASRIFSVTKVSRHDCWQANYQPCFTTTLFALKA
jgi:hypothetical protein